MTDATPTNHTTESPVLVNANAHGRLEDLLLTMEVEQHYINPSGRNIEAVFTIPLPLDAVLLNVSCTLGERIVVGKIAELEQAARTYGDAIAAGHAAVLLERAAAGLYTINLGNLLPGERAAVCYRFAQLAHNDGGQVRMAIPTAVAPRYGNPAGELAAAHQVSRVLPGAAYPFALDISIRGSLAAACIGSPSHTIRVARTAGESKINANAWMDRDFVLVLDELLGLADDHAAGCSEHGATHLAHAQFFVAAAHASRRPVACRILLDCSGSMTGPSIRSARSALYKLVGTLSPSDRLSVSCFGTGLRHVIASLSKADAACVERAVHGLLDAEADMGGTLIGAALEWAMRGEPSDILVVTDGQVWNTGEIIAAARASDRRVFAVGVGSAPVGSLLRELAASTGGACEFVAPGENMDGAVARILARMRQPCLEAARVEWPGQPLWQTRLPSTLPVSGTVHVFAAFAARPTGQVTLRAAHEDGSELACRAIIEDNVRDTGTLVRIAASLRLPDCAQQERIELALKHELVTEHTSLVLVHERGDESAAAAPTRVHVPHMLAAGWGGILRIPACFSTRARESGPQVHEYDIPAFLLKTPAQHCDPAQPPCQQDLPQARMPASSHYRINRMHDMENWFAPLEQASTLDQLHALWAPLLEQHGLTGSYEDPRYADAVMRFLAHSRLAANLKFGAVFACVSPFDFDLRLAYSALMVELEDHLIDSLPGEPILHSSCVAIPCSSPWLLGYVHGRFTEVVRAMGREGAGSSSWPAMFWNHYLVMAGREGDADAIREAIDHGADISFDGRAAAAAAVGVENNDAARRAALELLRELDPDRDGFDGTVLVAAASVGNTAVLSWLLERGVNIAWHPKALAAAAGNCQLECAELLLDQGADLHADGESALLVAIGSLYTEMIEILLERGAQLATVNETALQRALAAQPFELYGGENDFVDLRAETVALLLARGAWLPRPGVEIAAIPHWPTLREALLNHEDLDSQAKAAIAKLA